MCLSWSTAPEVLTNLQWPVCTQPPLIAPCISVWCESSHCSERPAWPPEFLHLHYHSLLQNLPWALGTKQPARTIKIETPPPSTFFFFTSSSTTSFFFSFVFSFLLLPSCLLSVVSVLITNTEPEPESSADWAFCSLIKARREFIEETPSQCSHLLLKGQDKSFSNLNAETCPGMRKGWGWGWWFGAGWVVGAGGWTQEPKKKEQWPRFKGTYKDFAH